MVGFCARDEESVQSLQKNKNCNQYGLGWRHIIASWAFLAFFVTYMLRVNINVAIVAMVEGPYAWDEKQQGAILSAFFYGYFLTQLPGGIVAGMFGSKWVFGLGLLLTSVLTLFTPLTAQIGPGALMGLRFVEGLAEGVLFPAMHNMLGKWVPPLERSKLPAFLYSGYFIGTVTTFAVSGLLAASAWGWPSIFYLSGAIGCFWFIGWIILAADCPKTHKWISDDECIYIGIIPKLRDTFSQLDRYKTRCCQVPWRCIAKSMPVYAICVSYFCHGFGFYTILTYLPIYLRNILGFDIEQNGLISGMPYMLAFFAQLFSSWFADFIRSKQWLNTTHVRKMFDISGMAHPT